MSPSSPAAALRGPFSLLMTVFIFNCRKEHGGGNLNLRLGDPHTPPNGRLQGFKLQIIARSRRDRFVGNRSSLRPNMELSLRYRIAARPIAIFLRRDFNQRSVAASSLTRPGPLLASAGRRPLATGRSPTPGAKQRLAAMGCAPSKPQTAENPQRATNSRACFPARERSVRSRGVCARADAGLRLAVSRGLPGWWCPLTRRSRRAHAQARRWRATSRSMRSSVRCAAPHAGPHARAPFGVAHAISARASAWLARRRNSSRTPGRRARSRRGT